MSSGGAQDMCLGDYWETAERRKLVSYTTAYHIDKLYLMTLTESITSTATFDFGYFDSSRSETLFQCSRPASATHFRTYTAEQ